MRRKNGIHGRGGSDERNGNRSMHRQKGGKALERGEKYNTQRNLEEHDGEKERKE